MNEQDRWSFAVLGERNPSVAPLEAAFIPADQVGELVDTFPRKRILRSCVSEDRTTGQKNLAPRSFAFVGLLHYASLESVKEKPRPHLP